MEPKRLFRRYCIKYPIFVFRFVKYSLGIGRTNLPSSTLSPPAASGAGLETFTSGLTARTSGNGSPGDRDAR